MEICKRILYKENKCSYTIGKDLFGTKLKCLISVKNKRFEKVIFSLILNSNLLANLFQCPRL